METSTVFHLPVVPLGLVILLAPICLALVLILTIEATIVRPANRRDAAPRRGGRETQLDRLRPSDGWSLFTGQDKR
jgi:hypothetical protein